MQSIRKFVVGAGTAGLIAAAALIASAQTGTAATRSFAETPAAAVTPSAACTASIQAIKDAVVADRSEDAAERAVAKTEGTDATDPTEDATERGDFIALFKAARTACVAANTTTPALHTFTPSPACAAALQALKAAWAQGTPTTRAQWLQLQSLAQAARTACGWTWRP